jgi:ribosomal-protein-alanine N-acetyltransferase
MNDKPHIRWMIRRDMPEVMAIERESFEFPWTENDFILSLRNRNCIGMVVEREERVVGFMIYELHTSRLHLLSLAVAANCRRQGIGRAMVEKLLCKLSQQRRTSLHLEVRESNLAAQVFFRAHGLRATNIVHDFYDDTPEDAYRMVYHHDHEQYVPANRISELMETA